MKTTWYVRACGLNTLVVYFGSKPVMYWGGGGGCDNKEWDLNWDHPFPEVLGYNRREDIKEIDITEFKTQQNDGISTNYNNM